MRAHKALDVDQVPLCDVVIAPVVAEGAGELLTIQRAAYATEARIYGDPGLPTLTESLPELQAHLAMATALKARVGRPHRRRGPGPRGRGGAARGELTVAPDWQGRGIGSRLLIAVESHQGDLVDTAALFTRHLSEANLTMYARREYREQRHEPLRPSVVLVHSTKPLQAADGPMG